MLPVWDVFAVMQFPEDSLLDFDRSAFFVIYLYSEGIVYVIHISEIYITTCYMYSLHKCYEYVQIHKPVRILFIT